MKLTHEMETWLAKGDRGRSSDTIFQRLEGLGHACTQSEGHPLDVADFVRCEKLLDAVPDFRERFDEMAAVSPQWRSLVSMWSLIARVYELERIEYTGKFKATNELIEIAIKRGWRGIASEDKPA